MDIVQDQGQPVLVHHIGFGDRNEPFPDSQQGADVEVLPGLGHHPLVGGDDQQEQIHAGGPGHHVLDEPFVPRNIHDPQGEAAGQPQRGEAQLDGDAPLLLLLETVRVDARQGLDQRGLPVIHMSGGAEDDMLHTPSIFLIPGREITEKAYAVKCLFPFSPGRRSLSGKTSLRRKPAANCSGRPVDQKTKNFISPVERNGTIKDRYCLLFKFTVKWLHINLALSRHKEITPRESRRFFAHGKRRKDRWETTNPNFRTCSGNAATAGIRFRWRNLPGIARPAGSSVSF